MTSSAQPEQPGLFLLCNGFSSSLATYVLDKHLRLQKSTNLSMLVAIQHIIQSYVTVFFKDDISRRQKSATWSPLRSSSKRFILSGQPMTNKLYHFYSVGSRHSIYIPGELRTFLLIGQQYNVFLNGLESCLIKDWEIRTFCNTGRKKKAEGLFLAVLGLHPKSIKAAEHEFRGLVYRHSEGVVSAT